MSTSQLKAAATLTAGLILFIVFFVQGVFFISANSPTYDEAAHLAAGYSYFARRDFRLNPEHPPLIKQLLALPLFVGYRIAFNPDPQHWSNGDDYLIGQDLVYKSILPADRILLLSRIPNLLICGVQVALTVWWTFRLWVKCVAIIIIDHASL